MDKKSRLRGPNFTYKDSLLLCDIITKYKDILANKKTDGASRRLKQKAWLEIMQEFNSNSTEHHRTIESLQQNYKNLKKKAKKSAPDVKMVIPVKINSAALIQNIQENFSSSDSWENVAESTGGSKENCQKLFDSELSPNSVTDPLLTKIEDEQPWQGSTTGSNNQQSSQDDPSFFLCNRANLRKKPHDLLTRKRKFKTLTTEKMELIAQRKKLLKIQLLEEQEKLDHNRIIRKLELKEVQAKYNHNETLRKIELEKLSTNTCLK